MCLIKMEKLVAPSLLENNEIEISDADIDNHGCTQNKQLFKKLGKVSYRKDDHLYEGTINLDGSTVSAYGLGSAYPVGSIRTFANAAVWIKAIDDYLKREGSEQQPQNKQSLIQNILLSQRHSDDPPEGFDFSADNGDFDL
jgi:hypothetical protein